MNAKQQATIDHIRGRVEKAAAAYNERVAAKGYTMRAQIAKFEASALEGCNLASLYITTRASHHEAGADTLGLISERTAHVFLGPNGGIRDGHLYSFNTKGKKLYAEKNFSAHYRLIQFITNF